MLASLALQQEDGEDMILMLDKLSDCSPKCVGALVYKNNWMEASYAVKVDIGDVSAKYQKCGEPEE